MNANEPPFGSSKGCDSYHDVTTGPSCGEFCSHNYTPMSQLILNSIVTAFEQLKDDVHIALHTQIGNTSQLEQRITACSQLLLHINRVG